MVFLFIVFVFLLRFGFKFKDEKLFGKRGDFGLCLYRGIGVVLEEMESGEVVRFSLFEVWWGV